MKTGPPGVRTRVLSCRKHYAYEADREKIRRHSARKQDQMVRVVLSVALICFSPDSLPGGLTNASGYFVIAYPSQEDYQTRLRKADLSRVDPGIGFGGVVE
jgi:hypothetical protein